MSGTILDNATDAEVWADVCRGSATAFEVAVRRHQSAVCAVAYALCGDRSTSEDIAQETFWIGWKQRETLEQPERLRPWLCGIARNLARQSHRSRAALTASLVSDPESFQPDPEDAAISLEEETLVWRTLEEIPETYREPLVLFYREQQSVAEVASALDLSVDAVKQRLSRGRAMMRDQVQQMVEGALHRTRPGVTLTVAIMAGLASGKSAWAATASAAGATVGKAAGVTAAGAIVGPVIGLAGAWFGTWLPAQMAPTNREREFILKEGRRAFLLSILFTLCILGFNLLPLLVPMSRTVIVVMVAGNVLTSVAFVVWIFTAALRMNRRLRELRATIQPGTDENNTAVRRNVQAVCRHWRGRVWRSSWQLCGWPLIDFNISDPQAPVMTTENNPFVPKVARGWIAVGDNARGILLAMGGNAIGGIAIGGRVAGVVAIGGMATGIFAVGGLAVGIVAFGGGAIAALALGGLAMGWQASGGLAVAWDTAVGGLAVAYHAAFGGGAVAHDFAVGGAVQALHANDEAAKAVLMNHPLKLGMDWFAAHNLVLTIGIVVISLLPTLVTWPLCYRRATPEELARDASATLTT